MAAHGTYAGLQQHNKAKEPVCQPCREAGRQYMREYRRRDRNYGASRTDNPGRWMGGCARGLGWPLDEPAR